MRRGWEAEIVMTGEGKVMAMATGSDGCTEHECGSGPLMEALTGMRSQTKRDVAAQMKSGRLKSIPAIEERRRIKSNLGAIVYAESDWKGFPVAAMGYTCHHSTMSEDTLMKDCELDLVRSNLHEGVAGAWDEKSFGFKVYGQKAVKKFREFAAEVKSGGGIFAGTFLHNKRGMSMPGVCIAVESLLRTEHRQAMAKAQVEFEAGVRLEMGSRADELTRIGYETKAPGRSVVGIWPEWKEGVVDGEIAYRVSPSYGVKWPGGMKTFDEVAGWLRGEPVKA